MKNVEISYRTIDGGLEIHGQNGKGLDEVIGVLELTYPKSYLHRSENFFVGYVPLKGSMYPLPFAERIFINKQKEEIPREMDGRPTLTIPIGEKIYFGDRIEMILPDGSEFRFG